MIQNTEVKKKDLTQRGLLLEVKNLRKYYPVHTGFFKRKTGGVKAVDDISLTLRKGETFGLVGESGCGKSTAGRTILRLTNATDGKIFFEGKDITNLSGSALRKARQDYQMVFQDPYASLNPKMMVGHLVDEPLRNYRNKSHKELKPEVQHLLKRVGLREEDYYKYPHEFSGGQRQRIGIARALALNPKLIVADEPVSALDVSIQSQVLNLLKELQEEFDLTYLFIAHDLSVVKHMSDHIGVMYLGKMVEVGEKESIYREPLHPYTQALISAIPEPDPLNKKERIILKGDVPNPQSPPNGCVFHTRCPMAMDKCKEIVPQLKEVKPNHQVACLLYENE
ncbi:MULTISPECIES: ABC transporter ATP-binding protein [unclassified Virgibacillus]|uniref:ABC transporter ATP-binding protein n=1 Tax=unclassified Virgibacillus TaxID=2620237 RepID=UPI00090AC542|nr:MULTISPECIES: dipeptide ABC transporter ATP-binding protein [unclassified Virgibacillus]API92269.1 peptide ABC transporter substrate-binding protein [Virgibacillus sp. 6R]MBS7427131.1 dipeptide ABC transporter ATP-binding protein [Virgibacillus sp. 19R1-5]